MFYLLIDILLSDDSSLYQRLELFRCEIDPFRALQVQSAVNSTRCRVNGCPVRYHYALEAPLASQHLVVQPRVFRRVDTPDKVVAVHDKSHTGFLDSFPECREIDFLHRPLVHVGAHAVPDVLKLVVGREMLHCSHDPLVLYAEDVFLRGFRSQIRVFAHVFVVSSAHRSPVDVHSRSQHDLHSACFRITAKPRTHLVGKLPVPCRCGKYAARIEGALGVVSDSLRPVGNPDRRYMTTCASTVFCNANKTVTHSRNLEIFISEFGYQFSEHITECKVRENCLRTQIFLHKTAQNQPIH